MIEWNDSYSVGFDTFDEDHKKLFGMLNTLESNLLDPTTKDSALISVINDLIAYAEFHFGKEEDVMARFDYPDLEKHKKEHDAFKEDVNSYTSLAAFGNLPPADKVMDFLRNWLLNHILKTDMEYTPFLKEKGFENK